MVNAPRQQRGLWLAGVGWALQTGSLAACWPGLVSTAPQRVLVFLSLGAGTLLLGAGIAEVAAARGHSRAFGVLAVVNLIGLIMAGLLPDLAGSSRGIPFECPHCGLHTEVSIDHAGRTGPCRRCGATVRMPSLLSSGDLADESRWPAANAHQTAPDAEN